MDMSGHMSKFGNAEPGRNRNNAIASRHGVFPSAYFAFGQVKHDPPGSPVPVIPSSDLQTGGDFGPLPYSCGHSILTVFHAAIITSVLSSLVISPSIATVFQSSSPPVGTRSRGKSNSLNPAPPRFSFITSMILADCGVSIG